MEVHAVRGGQVHRPGARAPLGRRDAVLATERTREGFVRGVAGLDGDVEDPEPVFEQAERRPLEQDPTP